MNRRTLRRIFTTSHAPHLAGIATALIGAAAAALAGELLGAVWAVFAAVWAAEALREHMSVPAALAAPEPEPVAERGAQAVAYYGGPQDGALGELLGAPADLLGTTLTVDGDDYEVTEVEHTCFRADFVPLAEPTAR